ncbi:U-box domain-containing protein kinase family protein [Dorcoceras hygrometricum]|uniref:U-box domain-containing protein kinase family protein n=1 Tax=Dorcoceras hygrometricum TaxID=472368 RepID=A0A2Z7BMB8_9LAMI|nr:U-box domain-containing protein kinase family protein [Dorcoceras hygrometricum]
MLSRAKNSKKLVKVLRDLAVEMHNHAAKMEKAVEEIGQILEDMVWTDVVTDLCNTMPISFLEEEQVKAFHDAERQQLQKSLDICIRAHGHAKKYNYIVAETHVHFH